MTCKYRFYCLLFIEFLFFPYLYLMAWVKKRGGKSFVHTIRKPVVDPCIYISIHEWGGYALTRRKKVRGVREFACGLQGQLERFRSYKGKHQIDLTLTLSGSSLYKELDVAKKQVDRILFVPNEGMDFAGYKVFYERIKNRSNAFVILTNSSVNAAVEDFLDDYIDYMIHSPEVGLMGISYNTKCYQSLVRNNFTPHLQSFFLLTTIEVLKEMVRLNRDVFPGAGITHKLLLIREGELAFSALIMKLGYSLAVVQEDGSVLKFDRSSSRYVFPFQDMRRHVCNPNKINVIK